MHGVIIEEGAMDYQVFQRNDKGFATITLSGRCERLGGEREQHAYVRVCRQDTGVPVINWRPARMAEGLRFTAEIEIPTGGPYRIETIMHHADAPAIERSFRGDARFHIYVGDLYIIAGQSNAAGFGRDFIPDPPMPGVHLFRNRGKWDVAVHPMNDSTDTIFPVNTDYGNTAHSPWLAFAKEIMKTTGIPVGLIQCSLGGSQLSGWLPVGKLYISMLERVDMCGGAVRGMLWHQGCADADAALAPTYAERFATMVDGLRGRFPDIHIFTVQLNRYTEHPTTESSAAWGLVKEAQRRAAMDIECVSVVPSNDLPTSDAIHISASGNLKTGLRVANQALYYIYGHKTECLAPNLSRVSRLDERTISLQFDNVYGRLFFFEKDTLELPFEVRDNEGLIAFTKAVLGRDCIELCLERQPGKGTAVSMTYQQNPDYVVPVDAATYLPVLSFYRISIE